ncbi:hypothetical protein DSO57_1010535 [Entomophthora muscae]|uniref:Uncharacterized protein n=2 Tax=Entomophthora muscae TaxID=34485 RepID=A0ACC2U4C8_9FUNG|nr:hypothetical protein DSO57_1038230 [Entomophthora muscae]KAJ9081865.1 hypothetical protein DSO57_1010535 [Entomophthora muscae]
MSQVLRDSSRSISLLNLLTLIQSILLTSSLNPRLSQKGRRIQDEVSLFQDRVEQNLGDQGSSFETSRLVLRRHNIMELKPIVLYVLCPRSVFRLTFFNFCVSPQPRRKPS